MRVQRVLTAAVPAWGLALGLLLAMTGPSALAADAESKPAIANDARVAGDRERTRFIADLSKKVDVHVFALGNPYRVIVDAPDVTFQMPDGIGKEKRGLVTAYRYGLFAPGKARIVIDVNGPFLIDKAFVLEPRDEQPARLVAAPWCQAGGGVGSRPWRHRSRDKPKRRHGEGSGVGVCQDPEGEARRCGTLRGLSHPRGRYLRASTPARGGRPEEGGGPLPLHSCRLLSEGDRQGDRRPRLYLVGGSLRRRGEGARRQGELLRCACRHRAAERFRRGPGEHPHRSCAARDPEPLRDLCPLHRWRAC